MNEEFEVKDENGELLEILTDDEQENTEGGASVSGSIICSKNSTTIGNVRGYTLSHIKIISNPIGATYSIGLNHVTITRTPGKKGNIKFSARSANTTIIFTVKFI